MIIVIGILSVLACLAAPVYIHTKNKGQQNKHDRQNETFKEKYNDEKKHQQFAFILLRRNLYYKHYIRIKTCRTLCLILFILSIIAVFICISRADENDVYFVGKQLLLLFSIVMAILLIYLFPGEKQIQYYHLLTITDRIINSVFDEKIPLIRVPLYISRIESNIFWRKS